MPIRFDPESSWKALEKRMAEEGDPVCRGLLTQVRDHLEAEIQGQLDPLMDTLIRDPQYHFRGAMPEGGPKGRQAVHSFYDAMIQGGGNRFQFEIERIFVDHGGVITEGKMRQMIAGAGVIAAGVEEIEGAPVDAQTSYLSETHLLTVWPAGVRGKLVGEDIFFGSPTTYRAIDS